MSQNIIHIEGKPYILLPLHEYRALTGHDAGEGLPESVMDDIAAGHGHPIRIIRKHRDLTQPDLADAAGISRPYLTEIETGRKDGSIRALKALALVLEVDVGLLAGKK